ncbi:hypothetical protein [Bradyrhizobium sp. USDA 4454]
MNRRFAFVIGLAVIVAPAIVLYLAVPGSALVAGALVIQALVACSAGVLATRERNDDQHHPLLPGSPGERRKVFGKRPA